IAQAVHIYFADCLPEGKLEVAIHGLAFGPNVGMPVPVVVGRAQTTLEFAAQPGNLTATMENRDGCQTVMRLLIPYQISPSQLGISGDSRTLGIGLTSLRINKHG